MARFGRFARGAGVPYEEYEGDYMTQEKEYVRIFKHPPDDPMAGSRLVAAISLERGESVREIG